MTAYSGYVNKSYKPKNDIICTFRVEPLTNRTMNAVAGESSTGTWTEVSGNARVKKISAKVFSQSGKNIKIAYPLELFEIGNIPQLMSSVAGNIFGMKEVKNLRLEDIQFPTKYVKAFKGPKFGISGIRKLLGVKERPLVGTIVKPKLGLNSKEHANRAYEAWMGGCDIVKCDENLTSQNFNPFRTRIKETLKMRNMAEKKTGETKIYMPNVTAETNEMIKRAEFVKAHGGRYIMVDILTVGWSALQTLRKQNLGLVIHAHRAGHAAFTRYSKHGISMRVISQLSRLIGVDQLHIGTVIGKMDSEGVLESHDALKSESNLKKVFSVCSGGLHPGHIPKLVEIFGKDIIIQAGGGVHSHPNGTRDGAIAMRQSVDATMNNISLREYAESREELALALKKWK